MITRSKLIAALTILTVQIFAICQTTYALAEVPEVVQVGIHRVTMEYTLKNNLPTLQIQMTGMATPERPDYEHWWSIRRKHDGDRLGLRQYWTSTDSFYGPNPTLYYTQQFAPDFYRNEILNIELVASPSDLQMAREWSKVLFLNNPVLETVIAQKLNSFILDNRSVLSQLVKNLENYGQQLQDEKQQRLWHYLTFYLDERLRLADYAKANPKYYEKLMQLVQATMNGTYQGEIKKKQYETYVPNLPALMVTHATGSFIEKDKIEPQLDNLIASFKEKHLPVIYLMHDDSLNDFLWWPQDRHPDYALFSFGGEHSYLISNPDIVMTGGYLELCFRRSIQDTISRYFLQHTGELRIHMPTNAIYTEDQENLETILKKTKRAKWGRFLSEHTFWKAFDSSDDSDRGDTDAIGDMDFREYKIDILVDGKIVSTQGNGSRHVKLEFWNSQADILKLIGQ